MDEVGTNQPFADYLQPLLDDGHLDPLFFLEEAWNEEVHIAQESISDTG